jgi:hypothetical protein
MKSPGFPTQTNTMAINAGKRRQTGTYGAELSVPLDTRRSQKYQRLARLAVGRRGHAAHAAVLVRAGGGRRRRPEARPLGVGLHALAQAADEARKTRRESASNASSFRKHCRRSRLVCSKPAERPSTEPSSLALGAPGDALASSADMLLRMRGVADPDCNQKSGFPPRQAQRLPAVKSQTGLLPVSG